MKQKERVDKQSKVSANDLLFISDVPLRKKIIDAIETISGLYLVEQDTKYPTALTKEIRRVIVLYAASIIETLLLYLYGKEKISELKIEYKEVHTLPTQFQLEPNAKFVIAKQTETPKLERELMLDTLLKIFSQRKVISKDLEAKIKKAKDIRNTFHLSKSRTGIRIDSKIVQISTEAVYETVLSVQNQLKKGN